VRAVLDFNRANLSDSQVSVSINRLIEQSVPPEVNERQYLGASGIASECLRKVQYDWMCDPAHPLRTRDIFARGYFFEELSRDHLECAGFQFAPDERLRFTAAGGLFCGHADGIVTAAPVSLGIRVPCIWEHKVLGRTGWARLKRDGLERAFPHYAAQTWLYQAYLGVADHPAPFTAVNADTCERLHLLLPFDPVQAQAWSDRAVMVIEATRVAELLPRLTEDPDDWRCLACGHRARCWR
jgi:hypothetical protein